MKIIKLTEELPDVAIQVPVLEEPSLEGPETENENETSSLIINLINTKWSFVSELNNDIFVLKDKNADDVINVLDEVRNDEIKHIGTLQDILQKYSPNVANI